MENLHIVENYDRFARCDTGMFRYVNNRQLCITKFIVTSVPQKSIPSRDVSTEQILCILEFTNLNFAKRSFINDVRF